MAKDPSEFWYKGEIGFFDNYVIPLAKKLKECEIFGVSSDEYLNYALQNRAEWEERGEKIVRALKADALSTSTGMTDSSHSQSNSSSAILPPDRSFSNASHRRGSNGSDEIKVDDVHPRQESALLTPELPNGSRSCCA